MFRVPDPQFIYHIGVMPPAANDPRTIGVIVRDVRELTITTSDDIGAPAEPGGMLRHLLECVECEIGQRRRTPKSGR